MTNLLSKIVVTICFIALVLILFDEKKDYLVYSILIVVIAGLFTAISTNEARELGTYVDAIEWDVIFFLISMFAIVEILKQSLVFHYIAKKIVNKYQKNIHKMFWMICSVSTISAAIIEDLSVAIIFIPIIVQTCKEIEVNPRPFLLGMTICINLASTLTPFGSAENVIIASYFDINLGFFLQYVALFFVISTSITLYLADKNLLGNDLDQNWSQSCEDREEVVDAESMQVVDEEILLDDIRPSKKSLRRNFIGLAIFVVLLIVIPELYLAGVIGLLIFVFLNPQEDNEGNKHPNVTKVFRRVDYKLIFFFICLFILVRLMELNGFILFLETQIENLEIDSIFLLSIIILLLTSVLSGLLDNAPVTVLFLPIIDLFTANHPGFQIPFIIAMILGVNLGGNFLPQGSAPDMMTLELSKEYCVDGLNYKVLVKYGGLFALLHVILGIGYLALIIYVFPI